MPAGKPRPHMSSCTYFIADLHLSADRPDITKCLADFADDLDHAVDALYVLGDLFEVWIGDDDVNSFTNEVADIFCRLHARGIPVYFIHGNRDFLIREHFAKRACLTLLPQEQVIDLYGTKTLIMHGDQLCTQDVAYQKFRKKSRSWWWPRLMLSLPLSYRRRIAARGRKISKGNQENLTQMIMDVTPSEVVRIMEQHQVDHLIHGHTHRPNKHQVDLTHGKGKRIVLGDWYEQGSYLKISKDDWDLRNIPFN